MTTNNHDTIEEDAALALLLMLHENLANANRLPLPYGNVGSLISFHFYRHPDTGRPMKDQLVLQFSKAEVMVDFCDIRRLPKS